MASAVRTHDAMYRNVSHYRQSDSNMLRIRIAAFRGRPLNGEIPPNIQHMELNAQGTTNTLTSVGKDNIYIYSMNNQIPFVQRLSRLCPRRGYSTALSARYDGWAGLYDEHGQHTIVLISYD